MIDVEQRPSEAPPWMVDGDYAHALLHLACIKMAQGDDYALVFGMVELSPAECPPPDPTPRRASPCAFQPGNFRGWVERFSISAGAALTWYRHSRAGDVFWPDPSGSERDGLRLSVGGLAEEPPWPHVATTGSLPFLNGLWGAVRAHYLCQPERSEPLKAILDSDRAVAWFNDQLFFDIRRYAEWLGALCLIAPNPVYRLLDRHHRTINGRTYTGVRIVPRAHTSLDSIRLEVTEHGPRGLTALHTTPAPSPYTLVEHVGTMTAIGHLVVCALRGVLDLSPPSDYFHVFGMETEIEVAQHHGDAPAMGKIPATPYSTTMYQPAYRGQMGAPPPMAPAGAFLVDVERQRNLREAAEQHQEFLFYEQPKAALDFVRGLIGQARSRVWIIDPYFDREAFLHTISAVARYTVNILIMSGGEYLSKKPREDAPIERGDELAATIATFHLTDRIQVFAMSSETPPFHDRFLVVDQSVWFLGNSFNSLGDRASMLVRLHNPSQVTTKVAQILQDRARVRPLDEWLVWRRQERQKAADATPPVADTDSDARDGEQ